VESNREASFAVGRAAAVPLALTQEVGGSLVIVTDVYSGKDLGTLELTITVF